MVNFLLHRPIAVTMTYFAILILGLVASKQLPVSLMPDVDIPVITVQIGDENTSARELENSVVRSLRRNLSQVAHLANITSTTEDGSATIVMDFEHGSNIDYAFIEVNEKIDRAISSFPKQIDRPTVIKASATDLPVFYLNLSIRQPKTDSGNLENADSESNNMNQSSQNQDIEQEFLELSDFAGRVISKRLEQLPEVALADITGRVNSEIIIVPDAEKLKAMDIPLKEIERAIINSNVNLGNLVIVDGQYQYNVRIGNQLLNKNDIQEIYFKHRGRLFQIRDVANVTLQPEKRMGWVKSDGNNAISMAIIKQSDAKMADLQKKIVLLMKKLRRDYPHINFTITRDQTKLLDYSIGNLRQSLVIGGALAFLIIFFFLKNIKSPLLIGLTIPTSLLVSLLFFHIIGISINIISLSGLVLGIGMMIDNSIIVIDNITQHLGRHQGTPAWKKDAALINSYSYQLNHACINGTNEVFRPMLSSVLTTCAVFIPLIFIKGIAGALFYEQAMAVAIGLMVSLIVSVTLLPVYFRLLYKRKWKIEILNKFLSSINRANYQALYEKGLYFTFRRQGIVWVVALLMIIGTFYLYKELPKSKLPKVEQSETILQINWGNRISLRENDRRIEKISTNLRDTLLQTTALVGQQQFILDRNTPKSSSEALIYLKVKDQKVLNSLKEKLRFYLRENYPEARYKFEGAGDLFSKLFPTNESKLELRFMLKREVGDELPIQLYRLVNELRVLLPNQTIPPFPFQQQIVLRANPELLTLYDVNPNQLYVVLKRAFQENEILVLRQDEDFVPVILGEESQTFDDILSTGTVKNIGGQEIRLASLLERQTNLDVKYIVSGQEGGYYPVALNINDKEVPRIMEKVRQYFIKDNTFEVTFSGSYFSNSTLIKELIIILLVAIFLLYFILASQFESLVLPLIVIIEIPIDIFGAFILLKFAGQGINLMSLIGIIVMSGIIINDSILKIDTINQLRQQGYSLLRALIIGGQRRLTPILMTSITTILALFPFLFLKGVGADIQRPLAYTVIGGMILGTVVSLYLIPLCYYQLAKFSNRFKRK